MRQMSIFDSTIAQNVVNIATVPQRSPFRYPGGKTWLVPHIRRWLQSLPNQPSQLIEPFAGGGIVSLTVAFERLVQQATMVEIDAQVAAVWRTIIYGDAHALAEQIANFQLSADTVEATLDILQTDDCSRAFQTIVKNRINRGGILAPGAGRIRQGENGKGIGSRWYPQTLKQRILDIVHIRDRLHFFEGDGFAILNKARALSNNVFFIDPPYTAGGKRAGNRLYAHSTIDHEELFRIVSTLHGDFLMTYDNNAELHELANQYNFDTEQVSMKNTHHATMTELLIGRNLDWAR